MRALLGSVSWLAFGVPMRKEPNQKFTDMWKPGWDLATLEAYEYGGAVLVPNAARLI